MPGPKKGSARTYARPKPVYGPVYGAPTTLGAIALPGRRYQMPSGDVLSNRKYRELVRQRQYGFAKPISSEKFAELNRVIDKQLDQSNYASPQDREAGRLIALRAAAAGSFRKREYQNLMYDILRNELGYDEPIETVWWEDDEYEDAA